MQNIINHNDFKSFLELSGFEPKPVKEIKYYKTKLKEYITCLKTFVDSDDKEYESSAVINFLLTESDVTNLYNLENLYFLTLNFKYSKTENDFVFTNNMLRNLYLKVEYIVEIVNYLFKRKYNARKIIKNILLKSDHDCIISVRKFLINSVVSAESCIVRCNANTDLMMSLIDKDIFLSTIFGVEDLNTLPSDCLVDGKFHIMQNNIFINYRIFKDYEVSIIRRCNNVIDLNYNGQYGRYNLMKVGKYYIHPIINLFSEMDDYTVVNTLLLNPLDLTIQDGVYGSEVYPEYIAHLNMLLNKVYSLEKYIGKTIELERETSPPATVEINFDQWRKAIFAVSYLIQIYSDKGLIEYYENKFLNIGDTA